MIDLKRAEQALGRLKVGLQCSERCLIGALKRHLQ